MAPFERRTGMKLMVKMQQETRESKKKTTLEFKEDINALIAAQMRMDAKLDRLVTFCSGRTPMGARTE